MWRKASAGVFHRGLATAASDCDHVMQPILWYYEMFIRHDIMRFLRLTTLVMLAWAGPALAAWPSVALVEDVTGTSAGVEFMDYVDVGKVIRLNPQDTIVLSYLYSCVRETITGGIITVGREHSEVESGKVERVSTSCDAGRMLLTTQLASQSAAAVVRAPETKRDQTRSPPSPQFTLYGLSPMVEVGWGGGTVEITRVDKAGERYVLTIGSPQSLRSAHYDFAAEGKTLSAGGVYRATFGEQSLTFKVDPSAKPGKIPIVPRLLRFDRVL